MSGKNKRQAKDSLISTNKPGEMYSRDIFIRGKVPPQNIVIIKRAIIAFLLIFIMILLNKIYCIVCKYFRYISIVGS